MQFRGLTIEAGEQFEDATEFYRHLLGEPRFVDDGAWAPFPAGEDVVVNVAGPRESLGHGLTLSVKTDDLEAAIAALQAAGAHLVRGIETGGHQRHAVLRDPTGVHIAVYSPLT